jgi:hypothetical protein
MTNKLDENITSDKELNKEQKKELNSILNMVDKDADKTVKTVSKLIIKENENYNKATFRDITLNIIKAIIVLMVLSLIIYATIYNQLNGKFADSEKEAAVSSSGTVLNISMNSANKLEYNVKSVVVYNELNEENNDNTEDSSEIELENLGENEDNSETESNNNSEVENIYTELNNINWVGTDIDCDSESYSIDGVETSISKETSLNTIVLNSTYFYIEFINNENNAIKEILFSAAKPDDVDTSDIQKQSIRYFESSNPVVDKAYTNSYNNSFLMLTERIGGGELTVTTLKNEIDYLESNMKVAGVNNGITLEFNELGNVNLSNFNELGNKAQVIYSAADDVLRISNREDNIDYMYIFSIDNEKIGCNATDLVETDTENVYITKTFDDSESSNYRTLAIATENSLYCIKFNEDYYESLKNELFEQLGIDSSDLKIKTIQSVIKTDD